MNIRKIDLLTAATTTGAGAAFGPFDSPNMTFQASGAVSASTGAASIKIQVSNDGTNWLDLGTITLTLGTAATSDGFAAYAAWSNVRANVDSISGTNASVTVTLAV